MVIELILPHKKTVLSQDTTLYSAKLRLCRSKTVCLCSPRWRDHI